MNFDVTSYLSRVKILKFVMGGMALFLLFLVVGLPVYNSQHEKLKFIYGGNGEGEEVLKNPDQPRIENPKFYGMDHKNQPYTIIAKVGEQQDKNNMTLDEVYSDIMLNSKSFVKMTSNTAHIAIDKNELQLEGNIKMEIDSGYTILTDKAKVLYKNRDAEGNDGVEVQSDKGHITADTFKTENSFDEIIFKKNVKTTLYSAGNNDKK